MVDNISSRRVVRLTIFAAVFVAFFILPIPCYSQVERPLAWLRDLTALQNQTSGSVEYRQAEVARSEKKSRNGLRFTLERLQIFVPFQRLRGPTSNFANRSTFSSPQLKTSFVMIQATRFTWGRPS